MAGEPRADDVGVAVDCTTCGRRKAPRGRSVAAEAANGMCSWDCPGYAQDPDPGDLWPGEKRAEFGYPRHLFEK
jgi:hypothetical protein